MEPDVPQSLQPLGRDEPRLLRQVEELVKVNRDPQRRRALLEWLAERARERRVSAEQKQSERPTPDRPEEAPPSIALLPAGDDRDPVPIVPGEILVAVERAGDAAEVLGPFGFEPVEDVEDLQLVRFRSADVSPERLREALDRAAEAGIEARPNHILPLNWTVKGQVGPEPTCRELPRSVTRPAGRFVGLVVAVDTGIAHRNDLRRDDGWLDGVEGELDPLDEVTRDGAPPADRLLDLNAGHGGFVAGVVRQVAPQAKVFVLRGLGVNGVGEELTVARKILKAAHIIRERGERGVINLSMGERADRDEPPIALRRAIQALPEEIVVVASAGNNGDKHPVWPAAFPEVIAVAGLTRRLEGAEWSSRGDWVDFSAVAEGIVSTFVVGEETPGTGEDDDPFDPDPDRWDPPNPNASWVGTSFAAPQISAAIAEFLAVNPEATRDDATAWLRLRAYAAIPGFGWALRLL